MRGFGGPGCPMPHEESRPREIGRVLRRQLHSDYRSGFTRDVLARNREVGVTYASPMTLVVPPEPDHAHATPGSTLARIRAGDVVAFEALFHSTHPALVAFATRYLDSRDRAEELVQDLFLDLWRTRSSWDVRGSLRSYLFGALRNRALNARRRAAIERGWTDDESHDAVDHLHSTPVRVDDRMIAEEQRATVDAAFSQLPERCRLAMHLRWREGMQYAEIAEVLGITAKSVENHLARGLKTLRARVLAP